MNENLLFDPYVIYESKGVKIGFIGLSSFFESEGVNVKNPIESLNAVLNEIASKTDIRVLLFSSANEDMRKVKSENFDLSLVIRSKNKHKSIDGGRSVPTYSLGDRGRTLYAFDLEINDPAMEFVDFWSDLSYEIAMKIGSEIISSYVKGEVDKVQVIYNRFVNVARQEIRNETFLPMSYDPEKKDVSYQSERLFEPSREEVVKIIIPRYLNTQIWQYLLESNASEQAARMLAMENATSNAQDMIKDLTLQFNKARQTAITTEMLEIVSGAEALN